MIPQRSAARPSNSEVASMIVHAVEEMIGGSTSARERIEVGSSGAEIFISIDVEYTALRIILSQMFGHPSSLALRVSLDAKSVDDVPEVLRPLAPLSRFSGSDGFHEAI